MIEQQYYTRERGGLFNQTDGYDTVAKSPQLKLDYIKKILHPLCSYDIPSELQRTGEQDETKYPPNMVIIPAPSGEMIVGQAVYKAKDFTRQRSTFFMHNFILSEYEKHRYIKEPEKLFAITGFQTSFDIQEGRQLPTLAALPYDSGNPWLLDRERLFMKLGITQEIFNKLIVATIMAVSSKKKIFIVLDVPIEELGEMAKGLLYHLYTVLPWQIAEELGVCTYSNKVEAKKGIHITFLDRNTLRYDGKQNKDFIFDFVNKKYLNVEETPEGKTYILGALTYSRNKMIWERINHWADTLASTLKDKAERTIGFYGQVIMLCEMSTCIRSGRVYNISGTKHRKELIVQLLKYLESDLVDDIRRELFEELEYVISVAQEEIKNGKLIEESELKALLKFKLDYCKNREQVEHAIQIMLLTLRLASREKNYTYVNMALNQVHNYKQIYKQLFEAIYNDDELRAQVIYHLINERFKNVKGFKELTIQIAQCEDEAFILVKDKYYSQLIYETFKRCLTKVTDLLAFFNELQEWGNQQKEAIYTTLVEEGEYYFLEHISLKAFKNERDLCKLKFSRSYGLENYEVIQSYQRLKTDLSYMSPSKVRISNRVQELIKIFYKQGVTKDDFYMLVYAFLEIAQEDRMLRLNMKKILAYLNEINPEIMLDFIVWAKGQEIYIDKKRFDANVIQFFITLKQKQGKIDKELIKSKLESQLKTRALSEKILYALKPKFIKWLGKHSKLAVGVGILAVIGTGSLIGVKMLQKEEVIPADSNLNKTALNPEALRMLMLDNPIKQEELQLIIQEFRENAPLEEGKTFIGEKKIERSILEIEEDRKQDIGQNTEQVNEDKKSEIDE